MYFRRGTCDTYSTCFCNSTYSIWISWVLFHKDMKYISNLSIYHSVQYCIVLYCIVLYCIVLYCVVLYCIVLYCVGLDWIGLDWIGLDWIGLDCIILYSIVLGCIVLYCIVLVFTNSNLKFLMILFMYWRYCSANYVVDFFHHPNAFHDL